MRMMRIFRAPRSRVFGDFRIGHPLWLCSSGFQPREAMFRWAVCVKLPSLRGHNANLWEGKAMRRVLAGLVLVLFVGVVGCHRHSFVVGSGGNLSVAPK